MTGLKKRRKGRKKKKKNPASSLWTRPPFFLAFIPDSQNFLPLS